MPYRIWQKTLRFSNHSKYLMTKKKKQASSVIEACFIGYRSLLHQPMKQASFFSAFHLCFLLLPKANSPLTYNPANVNIPLSISSS